MFLLVLLISFILSQIVNDYTLSKFLYHRTLLIICWLFPAIHSDHGVAWSDGVGIFLTPVSICGEQLQGQEHNKLGEFEWVTQIID